MADFEVGDLAWAKMKGFTPWPAKIVEPVKEVKQPKSKEPMHYVQFFGSNDYGWIADHNIFPFEQHKDEFATKNQTVPFKAAVSAILKYAEENPPRVRSVPKASLDSSKTNGVATPKKSLQVNHKKMSSNSKPKIRKVSKPKKESPGMQLTVVKKRRRSSDSNTSTSSHKNARNMIDKYSSLIVNTSNSTTVNHVASFSPSLYSEITKTSSLLTRPYFDRPVTPPMDLDNISEILVGKNITATHLKIGFLGLGIMGRGIVKNLIHSRHSVTVWNRSPNKVTDFVRIGAMQAQTPFDVVAASDITFSCVSDPQVAKELVFCNCGVLKAIQNNKGYVEMTSIDPDTSRDISEAITAKMGKYLEAPILGSKKPAEEGTLIILAAGDRDLFSSCRSCFEAMGKHVFYLGEVGNASKMNLVINMIMGTTYSVLAESMALAERTGISQKDLLEILELCSLKCPAVLDQGKAIAEGSFTTVTNMPLQHMQRNLHLALGIADEVHQPLPISAAANEMFKHAKRLGYAVHDVSAVYIGACF